MIISHLLSYKVIEFGLPNSPDGGIAIIGHDVRATMHETTELIIADIATCCEYLARYTHARGRGKDKLDAHREALLGARVISKSGENLQ